MEGRAVALWNMCGYGVRVQIFGGVGFMIQGSGCRVQRRGFRVDFFKGLESRV